MLEKRVAREYNRRAEEYDQEMISKFGEYYFKVIKKIVEFAQPRQDDIVLDIGAGTGAVSFALAPRVKRVIAIDISEGMLQEARKKAEDSNIGNIEFVVGDFLNPNVGEKADIIVSNIALHHLTDEEKEKAIKRMAEMLNDNGRIVLGEHGGQATLDVAGLISHCDQQGNPRLPHQLPLISTRVPF